MSHSAWGLLKHLNIVAYFHYMLAIQFVTLKHLYQYHCLSSVSIRLDGRKDIQSVKSAWSVLHAELKACLLTWYRGIKKDVKWTNNAKLIFQCCRSYSNILERFSDTTNSFHKVSVWARPNALFQYGRVESPFLNLAEVFLICYFFTFY